MDQLSRVIILFCVCPGVRGFPVHMQEAGTKEFTQIQSCCGPVAELEFEPRPVFPQQLSP